MRLFAILIPLLILSGAAEGSDEGIHPLVVILTFNVDLDTAIEAQPQAKQGPSFSQELVDLLEAGGHTVHDRAIESKYPDGELTEISVMEGLSNAAANLSCSALHNRLDEIYANRDFGMSVFAAYEDLHDRSLRVVASPNMCCEISRLVGDPSGVIYQQEILFAADWTKRETKDLARLCAAKAVAIW